MAKDKKARPGVGTKASRKAVEGAAASVTGLTGVPSSPPEVTSPVRLSPPGLLAEALDELSPVLQLDSPSVVYGIDVTDGRRVERLLFDWLDEAVEAAHDLARKGLVVRLAEHRLGDGDLLTEVDDDGLTVEWGGRP